MVNSIVGVGGLFDVATVIDMPKHNEDFDQTLAVWGLSSGPYGVLPLLGPSTVRDVFGLAGDAAMNPISHIDGGIISGTYVANGVGMFAVNAIDTRAGNLSTEKIATEAAVDRYEFLKMLRIWSKITSLWNTSPQPTLREREQNAEVIFNGMLNLQRREYLILDENVPENDLDLDFDFNNCNNGRDKPGEI